MWVLRAGSGVPPGSLVSSSSAAGACAASGTCKFFGGGDALGLSKKWPVLPWVQSCILNRSDRRSGTLAKVPDLGDRQNA